MGVVVVTADATKLLRLSNLPPLQYSAEKVCLDLGSKLNIHAFFYIHKVKN